MIMYCKEWEDGDLGIQLGSVPRPVFGRARTNYDSHLSGQESNPAPKYRSILTLSVVCFRQPVARYCFRKHFCYPRTSFLIQRTSEFGKQCLSPKILETSQWEWEKYGTVSFAIPPFCSSFKYDLITLCVNACHNFVQCKCVSQFCTVQVCAFLAYATSEPQ